MIQTECKQNGHWRRFPFFRISIVFLLPFFPAFVWATTLKVGETYTCDIGYVSHLESAFWTISAPQYLEFTSTPGAYTTRVTVRAIKAFSSPIVVQCKYYWLELDPTTGRYTYSRNTFKDWTFFIKEDKPEPSSVDLQPTSMTLSPGDTYSIWHRVLPENADQSLSWTVSPSGVVTCSDGFLRAIAPGTATVTARAVNGVSASCRVSVLNVDPTNVYLSSPSPIYIGQTITLVPELYPDNAQTTFTWSSSNTSVAAVNGSGAVTGKAEGTARITVRTGNNLSASCDVSVYKPVPSSISLNKSSLRLPVGSSEMLTYSVSPSYAIYTVSWESDTPAVVSVSNGRVEAKSSGAAIIKVMTDNGKTATCRVTVPPEPTAVKLTPDELELIIGRKKQISYAFTPSDAATRSVTWQSSDPKVASVSSSGEVTALRPGQTKITATTANGVVGSCELTVPMPLFQLFVWTKEGIKTGYLSTDEPEFSLEDDIVHFRTKRLTLNIHRDTLDKFTLEQVLPEHPKSIDMPKDMMLALGASQQLSITLTPTDAQTTMTWFNDAPDVVSVSQAGFVKALKVGEAHLMVQTSNGLRARCKVTVPEPRLRFYVWLRDGQVHGFDIEEKPEVTLGETVFSLSADGNRVEYVASDVVRFTLQDAAVSDPETAVVQPRVEPVARPRFSDGALTVDGGRPNTPVCVYDAAGRQVLRQSTDSRGNLLIPLASLRAGVYIISTGQTTFKIQK